ncbi:MAG: cytochrome c biogenesis CcdA family protein [Anaerolineae bacterium]
MDLQNITFVTALVAGVLSFVSPCVVPLIPAYLSYITGLSVEEMAGEPTRQQRWEAVLNAAAFVLGLSLIFTLLGASANLLGQLLLTYQPIVVRLAGLIIIAFGLQMMGILKLDFLYREKRVDFTTRRAGGYLGSLIMGAAFSIGWVPCVGPILAGILTMASQASTVNQGMLLLFIYSLGLGVPFILTAAAIDRLSTHLQRIKRHLRTISIVSGLVLILMGVLVFTNQLLIITAWFIRVFGTGLTL